MQRCGGTFKDEVKVSKSKNENEKQWQQWAVQNYGFEVQQLCHTLTLSIYNNGVIHVIISQYDRQENGLFLFTAHKFCNACGKRHQKMLNNQHYI